MSNTPYLYVIRKKHDVDDLDKYLEAIRGVGELNFFCKPKKRYNVLWGSTGNFRYLKTDLVAAITVDRSDILESFREDAGIVYEWHKRPRMEQRAIGKHNGRDWEIVRSYKYDENYRILPNENVSWQDYAYHHVRTNEMPDIHAVEMESCLIDTLETANALVNCRELVFDDAEVVMLAMTELSLKTAKTKKHLFDSRGRYIG